jgi:hypothetical protein
MDESYLQVLNFLRGYAWTFILNIPELLNTHIKDSLTKDKSSYGTHYTHLNLACFPL